MRRSINEIFSGIMKKRNALKNNTLCGLFLGLASVSVMFLLMGALYFKNEARIYDSASDKVIRIFTVHDSLDAILEENDITIGEFDRVEFGGVTNGETDIIIRRSLNIPVNADGKTVYVECAYDETVSDIIERAGITINAQDVIKPDPSTACSELSSVDIYRGYPVYIKADGEIKTLYAYKQTAQELLKRAGIALSGEDYIDCDPNKVIEKEETVKVIRVTYKTIETYEAVPYSTITRKTNLASIYTSQVTQKGENGTRTNTSLVKYIDGVRVSETPLSSEITKESIPEITEKGAALATPYSKKDSNTLVLDNGIPTNYKTVLTGKSCAYTAPLGSGTASGRKLEIGTVAVDPNIIPYGSELYIVSTDGSYVYGYAIAADTGNLTPHGVLVDLFMGNSEDYYDVSLDYGAKQVNVYILN